LKAFKTLFVYLKLLNGKAKFVLPFFWVFKGFEGHVGDKDRVMRKTKMDNG